MDKKNTKKKIKTNLCLWESLLSHHARSPSCFYSTIQHLDKLERN